MTSGRKLVLWVQAAPYVAGLAVALVCFSWQGVVAGIVVAALLRMLSFPVIRRIHSRVMFAAYGAYVDPGYTGELALVTVSALAPRVLEPYDTRVDGSEPKDWLLPDGAWMENVVAPLATTADARYVGARHDLAGSSFLLYDSVEHVRYRYEEDDAPTVYADLFAGSGAAFAAVLAHAERTPLRAWRGMWLEHDALPEQRARTITKVLSSRMVLTATLVGPEDVRSVADPYELLIEEPRRLAVNGFATPYLCEDLEHSAVSPDGKNVLVKGCVVDESFCVDDQRWYFRGQDGGWIVLSPFVSNSSGSFSGYLESVAQLSATEAVFVIRTSSGAAGSCWIQTATQALPFKVPMTRVGGVLTCRVPLQKFA